MADVCLVLVLLRRRKRESVLLDLDGADEEVEVEWCSMHLAEGPGLFRMSDNACRCFSEVRLYDLTPSTFLCPVLSMLLSTTLIEATRGRGSQTMIGLAALYPRRGAKTCHCLSQRVVTEWSLAEPARLSW